METSIVGENIDIKVGALEIRGKTGGPLWVWVNGKPVTLQDVVISIGLDCVPVVEMKFLPSCNLPASKVVS